MSSSNNPMQTREPHTVAVRLRESGYRPTSLARRAGVDKRLWSDHLNLETPLPEADARKVAAYLGLHVLDVFPPELVVWQDKVPRTPPFQMHRRLTTSGIDPVRLGNELGFNTDGWHEVRHDRAQLDEVHARKVAHAANLRLLDLFPHDQIIWSTLDNQKETR